MRWHKIFFLLIPFTFSNCLFYSLSGSSISKECKTFSLGQISIDTTDSPHNVVEVLKSKLRSKLKTETGLSEVDSDGDVHFDCSVTACKTALIPGNDKVKISMSMVVSYRNKYDLEKQFKEKKFDKSIDVTNSDAGDHSKNAEKILDAILSEVFCQSVNSWD